MKRQKTLRGLLQKKIANLVGAERQLLEILPRLAEVSRSPILKGALLDYLHDKRLERPPLSSIASHLKITPTSPTRDGAVAAIIHDELDELNSNQTGPVLDASVIAGLQQLIHYEISSNGTAKEFSKLLGDDTVSKHLTECLDEEKNADKLLSQIATTGVNEAALAADLADEGSPID